MISIILIFFQDIKLEEVVLLQSQYETYRLPTSMTISKTKTLTLAYPEAHMYVTFKNLVTVAFDMVVTMRVDCG